MKLVINSSPRQDFSRNNSLTCGQLRDISRLSVFAREVVTVSLDAARSLPGQDWSSVTSASCSALMRNHVSPSALAKWSSTEPGASHDMSNELSVLSLIHI